MPIVKLTAYQFDHRDGAGYTRRTRGDVFEVDDATAARLLKAKAITVLDEGVDDEEVETVVEGTVGGGEQASDDDVDPEGTEDPDASGGEQASDDDVDPEGTRPPKGASAARWKEYAKGLGIDTANKSKAEIIALVGDR